MFKKIAVRAGQLSATAGLLVVSAASHAAMDTSAITSALTDAGTAAGVVAAAGIVVYVGIKAFGYVKQALGR